MRPVIGINLSFRPGQERLEDGMFLKSAYVQAVVQAGGLPQLLPLVEDMDVLAEMVERVDGLLLSGGDRRYREATCDLDRLPPLGEQNPRRHAFDLALCRLALEKNVPVLGICRGHQTLNEAAGGTMILNLHTVTGWQHYQQEPADRPTHTVEVIPRSRLAGMLGTGRVWVNSLHRQAVDRPAPGFEVTSYSHDGIVESVESRRHAFAVGVQFHPETLLDADARFINVYRQLVEAAKEYRARR